MYSDTVFTCCAGAPEGAFDHAEQRYTGDLQFLSPTLKFFSVFDKNIDNHTRAWTDVERDIKLLYAE
jgi:hypothetical protein